MLAALKAPADQAEAAIERLNAEAKRLASENGQLKMKLAMGGGGTAAAEDDTVDAGGVKMVGAPRPGARQGGLGQLADTLKNTLQSGVVVLASENDGRVTIVVSVTKDLVPRVHAGNIVKKIAPLVGGGGGGRPDFAEAGGKNPADRPDARRSAHRGVGDGVAQVTSSLGLGDSRCATLPIKVFFAGADT